MAQPAGVLKFGAGLALALAAAPVAAADSGGGDNGAYYSSLRQINDHNVTQLGFAWEYRTGTTRALEATPVVVGKTLYTSGNWGMVYALNAASGEQLWTFDPHNDGQTGRYTCCDVVNRGVVVRDGRVFVASNDGRLFALAATTGKVIWSANTFAAGEARSSTGAPQLAGDLVLIGNSGTDLGPRGVRGYVTAYEIATGRQRWRFYVVPTRDESNPSVEMQRALRTWDPKATPSGGAVWAGTSYDPKLDLIYIGTGNAAPYQPEGRNPSGKTLDNLYTACVMALNARTGKLAWWFQTTPADSWDQDATSPFIQAELQWQGRSRQVLMQASKNGFFYVWDRATGELLSGKAFTYINWASGLDAKGRPKLTQHSDYTHEPQLIYPSSGGGHAWTPMSFSTATELVYIPVLDAPMIWTDLRHSPVRFVDSTFGVGLIFPDKDYRAADWAPWFGPLPDYKGPRHVIRGVLRAWDPIAGRTVWEKETSTDYFVYDGGVLSTAGNLVFQGRADGSFVAYAADSGKALHTLQTGVGIMAAPTTYEVDGTQYVVVMEGYGGGAIGLPFPPGSAGSRYQNIGRIVAFRLGGGAVPLPEVRKDLVVESPPAQHASADEIGRGSKLYMSYCSRCHVFGVGVLPDLRRLPAGVHSMFADIVLRGRLSSLGMGRFDDVLTDQDVSDIHAYLLSEGTK